MCDIGAKVPAVPCQPNQVTSGLTLLRSSRVSFVIAALDFLRLHVYELSSILELESTRVSANSLDNGCNSIAIKILSPNNHVVVIGTPLELAALYQVANSISRFKFEARHGFKAS